MRLRPALLMIVLVTAHAPMGMAESTSAASRMGSELKRGLTDVITSPLEIPLGIQSYHEKPGFSGVRHSAGFVEGTARFLERFGSGVLRIAFAPMPGQREILPSGPKPLF
ncbi:MAG: hypothetical protein FGM27_05185 [Candidatus Omnitrophica bacterium]|nr:hypothetical protein [Candidatus Omnitrophota bacterium]